MGGAYQLRGSADGCGGWSGTLLITVAGSASLQAGYSTASAPLRSARITANPWSPRAPGVKKKCAPSRISLSSAGKKTHHGPRGNREKIKEKEKKTKSNPPKQTNSMMLKQHLLFVLCSVCGTVVKGERSSEDAPVYCLQRWRELALAVFAQTHTRTQVLSRGRDLENKHALEVWCVRILSHSSIQWVRSSSPDAEGW